jgi:hypothetical protein
MPPAALSLGKSASVFIGKEARWVPKQSGRGDERKNFLRQDWKLGLPVLEPVAVQSESSADGTRGGNKTA